MTPAEEWAGAGAEQLRRAGLDCHPDEPITDGRATHGANELRIPAAEIAG